MSNGTAECKPVQADTTSTDYKLVIGLAVGIPLFFIAAFVIAVLVYIRFKRKARNAKYSMDDSQSDFSKIFRRLPLYGTPRPLSYRPDSYFDSGDDDSRHHYNATLDSNITSPWATDKLKGTRGLDVQEPASFSWDHFYQNVPEGEFHIKRARVSVVPTPTFQISRESQEFDA
ncbi:uncharacterized protein LOC112557072 [Pomacea canaliculata]|uniref:uncharacterized protein LOC112557072 n=1 Tax=Pomacea canaliculata TaxID=400727 RepID=UPI000D73DF15|nr:uncharacterized protein LOC112557072 [Pomacea canaliculata]